MKEPGALEELRVAIQMTAAMEEVMVKETITSPIEATSTIGIPYLPKRSSSYEDSLRGNALNIIYLLNIPNAAARPPE